jgi:hypothetical protein
VRIHAEPTDSGALSVEASATAPGWAGSPVLFVALTEDHLVSSVSAGENRGVTLSHDHVVRQWIGPIELNNGHVEFTQIVTLRADWNRARLGVAGFVQDPRTGQVLQAVGAESCLRS